jgi:hypothetical protein
MTRRYSKVARKHDAGKIFVKVMALILALLMILAVAGTLLYYLLH